MEDEERVRGVDVRRCDAAVAVGRERHDVFSC
jgi:hypothetical protein